VFVGCGDDDGNGKCPLAGTTWYCEELDDTITFNTDGETFTSTGNYFLSSPNGSYGYDVKNNHIHFGSVVVDDYNGSSFTLGVFVYEKK